MLSTKQEIAARLEELLGQPDFHLIRSECAGLIEQYLALDVEEKLAAGLIGEDAGPGGSEDETEPKTDDQSAAEATPETSDNAEESAETEDELDAPEAADPQYEHFVSLIDRYHEKREELLNLISGEEKSNLERKQGLIESLRKLIQEEEHIGKAFKEFNEIREKWLECGPVPEKHRKKLHSDYSSLQEQFYYNINIYKQLEDHHMNRNLELKEAVIENLRALDKEKSIRKLDEGVNECIERWNEIGPTRREDWDKLKETFWSQVRVYYDRIRDYYQEKKKEWQANLEQKEALIARVNEMAAEAIEDVKGWQEKTDEIIAIQESWKTIGFASKEKNEAVWKKFRKACDAFFTKKRDFFKEIHEVLDEHAEAKKSLIEKAEALKDSTDWKNTSQALIALQKEWKNIGGARQRQEQKLWKRFRAACDHFFEAKKAHFAEQDKALAENLAAKEALIAEIQSFEPVGEKAKDLETLRGFSARFGEIGFVPFKQKDSIYKHFTQAMDAQYQKLKMNRLERENAEFEQKLEALKSDDNDRQIDREARMLRDKMSKLEAEAIQLENNLGFFANSKGADALKKEVEKKIQRARDEVSAIKQKLRMLKAVR
ncbi:MAG: DUF349 domain-containing protein [Cryomorphaceae bacterium]|nr:MAG: DUF349 domain-containing protein [Cryomorphaceae bacterium]